MSELYRTPEEYAELYARDNHMSVEEAKETAAYKNFTDYVSNRVCQDDKRQE